MFTGRKFALIFVFLIKTTNCLANSDDKDTTAFTVKRGVNILYYVDNSPNENQFLIPFIESELKNMICNKDTLKRNLFNSVKSLNFLTSGDKANDTLHAVLDMFNKNNIKYKHYNNETKENEIIVQNLKNQQFFLKINIHTLNNLIEYQFVLFKVRNNPHTKLDYLELRNYRATSVFINPEVLDYKIKLRMALRQIITEGNDPPIPLVTFKNQNVTDDTIFSQIGRFSLIADAVDNDSSPDQLAYNWEIDQYPNSNYHSVGKKLDIVFRDSGVVKIILKVSDGINTAHQEYIAVIRYRPTISILQPTDNKEFYTNTYHLYTYHNTFKLDDFSSIINIDRKNINIVGDQDYSRWSKLIPEVKLRSTVDETKIGISTITFNKIGEDSISNYKEKPVPYLHSRYYWQLSDESSLFTLDFLDKQPFQPDSNHYAQNYIYTYSIFENNNATEAIRVPTTRYFRVTASDHGIQNSEDFQIHFIKINRLSPFLHFSDLSNIVNKQNYEFTLFGIGAEYLFFRGLSADASLGTSTSHGFSSPVVPYYKIGTNLRLLNYKNLFQATFTVSEIFKKTFSFPKNENGVIYGMPYRSRLGFGAYVESNFCKCQLLPASWEYFFTYYPIGYELGSFLEIGVRLKANLSK
jgi:hypothetical protein